MSEYIPAVCGIESKLWLRFSSTLSILMTSSFQNWHRNHRFKTYTARITCACGLHQKNRCENGLPKKMSTTKLKINSKGASLNDKIYILAHIIVHLWVMKGWAYLWSQTILRPLHILSNFEIMITKPEM